VKSAAKSIERQDAVCGPSASSTHLVLIPSYNPGEKVFETVTGALAAWKPVWVVVDGSSDGTEQRLIEMAREDTQLKVFVLPRNRGKGAAVLHGLREAADRGFTHALIMDSDGQHPSHLIPAFMAASQSDPLALVLGKPVFGPEAPRERIIGRKICNAVVDFETLFAGIGDSLFGFRVYPIAPLVHIMKSLPWMRRFDFDAEAVVRLVWQGFRPVNMPAPVRYLRPEEGGVSHFNYLRDNILLTSMHIRLLLGFLIRLPVLMWRKLAGSPR
jgi:glycosyltransferase involved in cell wall biosynthesis